eukprot:1062986-Prymnesium_polylepis.1
MIQGYSTYRRDATRSRPRHRGNEGTGAHWSEARALPDRKARHTQARRQHRSEDTSDSSDNLGCAPHTGRAHTKSETDGTKRTKRSLTTERGRARVHAVRHREYGFTCGSVGRTEGWHVAKQPRIQQTVTYALPICTIHM